MSIIGLVILAFAVVFIFIFNDMILKRNVVESAYAAVRGLLKMRCDFLDTLDPEDGNAAAMQEVAAAMRKADIAGQIELDSKLTALAAEYLADKIVGLGVGAGSAVRADAIGLFAVGHVKEE